MATIDYPDQPRKLRMSDFRAYMDGGEGLAKSCRFAVVIRPQGQYVLNNTQFSRELMYLCEVAEMPGRGFVNIDLRYYGPSFKLPVQTQYEDINFTFLCRNQSFERQFFDDWQLIINPINTYDFNYRDDYRAEIDIYQFADAPKERYGTTFGPLPVPVRYEEADPEAQYCITLHDAYPIFVNPQPMTWQDDQFQRLVVNFTYFKWSRKGLDPISRGTGPNGYSFNLVEGRSNEGLEWRQPRNNRG